MIVLPYYHERQHRSNTENLRFFANPGTGSPPWLPAQTKRPDRMDPAWNSHGVLY
jgi:hypothetical protein